MDQRAILDELRRQHTEYDQRLVRLNRSVHLTPSEEVEVRQLKRMKLRAKDHIHTLIRQQG